MDDISLLKRMCQYMGHQNVSHQDVSGICSSHLNPTEAKGLAVLRLYTSKIAFFASGASIHSTQTAATSHRLTACDCQ